jgi:hypothetical protein
MRPIPVHSQKRKRGQTDVSFIGAVRDRYRTVRLEQKKDYEFPSRLHRAKALSTYTKARRENPALVSAAEAYFGNWGPHCMPRGSTPICILCITPGAMRLRIEPMENSVQFEKLKTLIYVLLKSSLNLSLSRSGRQSVHEPFALRTGQGDPHKHRPVRLNSRTSASRAKRHSVCRHRICYSKVRLLIFEPPIKQICYPEGDKTISFR